MFRMNPTDARPLDGVLVVSLEQAVAAPLATCRLADAGARVIKLERANGDFARAYDTAANGQSAYFAWLNRGKESLTVDIKDEADRELVLRILAKADVFIQNLAVGAAARSGLGSDELRARFPHLITCDISGYGETGPYADMKAYDLLVQAEAGLVSVNGTPDPTDASAFRCATHPRGCPPRSASTRRWSCVPERASARRSSCRCSMSWRISWRCRCCITTTWARARNASAWRILPSRPTVGSSPATA